MRRIAAIPALAIAIGAVNAGASDTGPEYLEQAEIRDPLKSGFHLFRLPFEDQRQNTLHTRTFYQDRTYDGLPDRQNWAGGGWLNVVGTYFEESVKVAGTVYTSQKLWADQDKAETGALQPDHNGYTQLGEIYMSFNLDKVAVQAGRYEVDLPYINKHDIRMTPQTFQGAQAVYQPRPGWSIGTGVLTHIKPRTREGFDALYERAGLDRNEDVWVGGSLYEVSPGTQMGVFALHAPDYHNGAYIEFSKRFARAEDRYIQVSGQYTWQESTGDELDGDISARHYGARVTWKRDWYSGSLAWTDYPEEDRLRSPWGGIPGYTSVLINDFDRPEETAWLLGGTVELDSFGARGLSVNAKAIYGDTPDCGVSGSPDQDEYNLNFNYRPPLPKLAGLLLQLRFGWVNRDDSCEGDDAVDITEVRFVTNYAFDF